mgnify:FL=1
MGTMYIYMVLIANSFQLGSGKRTAVVVVMDLAVVI